MVYKQAIVDSMILMDYDKNYEEAIYWWEDRINEGWEFYVSIISVMERLKGIAKFPGSREMVLKSFKDRLQTLKRERKIVDVLPLNRQIAQRAHDLILEYCKNRTPPARQSKMESLICDMFIAATAINKNILLFTFNEKDFNWISGLSCKKPDYEVKRS